jgi:phosphatidylserine/phosphatidylglycerophosphate/cardiolipin synthase-like enzyme
VIIETPNLNEGEHAYSTLQALGPSVIERCRVYYWPLEKRSTDASGRAGLLHVKCAVADGRSLFLSSANLTEYAFTLNIELGVLINGGPLPERVETHFQRMILISELVRI